MVCIVKNCPSLNNCDNQEIEYFSFPSELNVQREWIQALEINVQETDLDNAKVCCLHFDESAFANVVNAPLNDTKCRKLLETAIPTLYLPISIKFTENDDQLKYETLTSLNESNIKLRKKVEDLEEALELLRCKVEKERISYKKLQRIFKHHKDQYFALKAQQYFHVSANEQWKILEKIFSVPQIKILTGKKKIYWSDNDMAVAYTIRHLSNKRFYLYLTKTLQIPLPAMSSIKRWATMRNHKRVTGNNEENFTESD